jgi:hypothetical protein
MSAGGFESIEECINSANADFENHKKQFGSAQFFEIKLRKYGKTEKEISRKEIFPVFPPVISNDEKVWWNEEKQDWETIDEAVSRQSNVDLGNDCDGDLEAMENDLIAMNNEEKDAEKIIIARSTFSEGKFSVSIRNGFTEETVRDFLPTQEMAIQCAQFVSNREGIDIIENQAAKDDAFEKWFHDNAHRMEFHCIAPFCSYCNKDVTHEAYYIGITDAGIPFEFCKQCRDMLQQRKASETSQLERIGA